MRWIYAPSLALIIPIAVVMCGRVGNEGFMIAVTTIFGLYMVIGCTNAAVQPGQTMSSKGIATAEVIASWFVGFLAWAGIFGLANVL